MPQAAGISSPHAKQWRGVYIVWRMLELVGSTKASCRFAYIHIGYIYIYIDTYMCMCAHMHIVLTGSESRPKRRCVGREHWQLEM